MFHGELLHILNLLWLWLRVPQSSRFSFGAEESHIERFFAGSWEPIPVPTLHAFGPIANVHTTNPGQGRAGFRGLDRHYGLRSKHRHLVPRPEPA